MELSSHEAIYALMPGYKDPALRVRRSAQDAAQRARRGRRARCKCSQCRQCLDDARWERIFAEKFADPNYYTRPITHTTSPLASL